MYLDPIRFFFRFVLVLPGVLLWPLVCISQVSRGRTLYKSIAGSCASGQSFYWVLKEDYVGLTGNKRARDPWFSVTFFGQKFASREFRRTEEMSGVERVVRLLAVLTGDPCTPANPYDCWWDQLIDGY